MPMPKDLELDPELEGGWEDKPTEPIPEGLRRAQSFRKATAKLFNRLQGVIFDGIKLVRDALRERALRTEYNWIELVPLAGTTTGQTPKYDALGTWPCWLFQPEEPSTGKVEELFKVAPVRRRDCKVHLYIASDREPIYGSHFVFSVGVIEAGSDPVYGGLMNVDETIYTVETPVPYQGAWKVHHVVIDVGERTPGNLLRVRIFRVPRPEVGDDLDIPLGLLGVEVT